MRGLAISLALTVALAGLAEIAVRGSDPGAGVHGDRRWLSESYPDRALSRQASIDLHDFRMEEQPEVGYRPKPEQHFRTLNVNAARTRGPAVGPKRPGSRRVILLGGSFAFGIGATGDDRTVAGRLADLLGSEDIEVINLGVPGYVASQELADLRTRGAALEPDVVVLLDGINDIYVSAVGGRPGEPLLDAAAGGRFSLLEWVLGSGVAERLLVLARELRGPVPIVAAAGASLDELARTAADAYAARVRDADSFARARALGSCTSCSPRSSPAPSRCRPRSGARAPPSTPAATSPSASAAAVSPITSLSRAVSWRGRRLGCAPPASHPAI